MAFDLAMRGGLVVGGTGAAGKHRNSAAFTPERVRAALSA